MELQSSDGLELVRRYSDGRDATDAPDGLPVAYVVPAASIAVSVGKTIGKLVERAVRAGDSKGFRPAFRFQPQPNQDFKQAAIAEVGELQAGSGPGDYSDAGKELRRNRPPPWESWGTVLRGSPPVQAESQVARAS